jgi:hypothetical protein
MSRSVILAGQTLHGRDRLGHWQVKAIDGLNKTPPSKGETADRPGADGEYDLPVEYGARSLVITGRVVCRSILHATRARDQITALLRVPGRLQVTDPAGTTLWMDVKRNGQISADLIGQLVRFTIEAKAVDPCKYGGTVDFVRTNGTITVYHQGNHDALPTVVVRGSAANGYRLNGPGGLQYRVTRALETGKPHRIEFRDGLLRVDGNLVSSGVATAQTWPVAPGPGTDFDINVISGGTAEATITITDTYI